MAFRWCLSTALAARHPTIIPHCQRSALRERRKILIDLPGFGYSDKPRVFVTTYMSRLWFWSSSSATCACSTALFGHTWEEHRHRSGGATGRAGDHAAGLGTTCSPAAAVQQAHCGAVRVALSLTAMPSCWRRSARRGRVVYKTAPLGRLAGCQQPDTRQRRAWLPSYASCAARKC